MKIAVSLPLLGILALTAPAGALLQDGAADQEQPAAGVPVTIKQDEDSGLKLVPGSVVNQQVGNAIPDIQAHRIRALDYVRRPEQVADFDVSAMNLDADPVMWIGERPVPRTEFRRRLLMSLGMNEIEKHITRVLTLKERKRRIAEGEDSSRFEVNDDVVTQKMQEYLDIVEIQTEQQIQQDPSLADKKDEILQESVDAYLASIESSVGMEAYKDLLAAEASFEKVFMPDTFGVPVETESVDLATAATEPPERPSWFPLATWEALGSNDQSKNLRYFLMNSVIDGTPVPSFFKTNIVNTIRDGLVAHEGIAFFFDDLSIGPDVLCTLGEATVNVDDIWPQVAPLLADTDVKLVVRELVKLDAMRTDLQEQGAWIDDAAMKDVFAAHAAEYEGTLFPLKNIIMFRGYTSVDRYREHYRYREAFNRWLKADTSDDEVLAHFQTGGRLFFERGSMVLDIAFNPIEGAFEEASFATASNAMQDYFAEVGADFDQLLAKFPMWEPKKKVGDDRTFQRAPLRMRMAESELSAFTTGLIFSDAAFYHGIPGEVFGPWPQRCRRHAWGAEQNAGVWMVRVVDYVRRQPLPAFDGRNYELAWEDYLDLHYFDWAESLLDENADKVRFAISE